MGGEAGMARIAEKRTVWLAAGIAIASIALAPMSATAAVFVSSNPTKHMSCSGGVCTPTAAYAVLNVSDLANMLASSSVTVQSGSSAMDIDLDAGLSWTSASRLTLDSY